MHVSCHESFAIANSFQVFHHHRELEKLWREKKTLLTQRYQLRVYEQDVDQVGVPFNMPVSQFHCQVTTAGGFCMCMCTLDGRHHSSLFYPGIAMTILFHFCC